MNAMTNECNKNTKYFKIKENKKVANTITLKIFKKIILKQLDGVQHGMPHNKWTSSQKSSNKMQS